MLLFHIGKISANGYIIFSIEFLRQKLPKHPPDRPLLSVLILGFICGVHFFAIFGVGAGYFYSVQEIMAAIYKARV